MDITKRVIKDIIMDSEVYDIHEIFRDEMNLIETGIEVIYQNLGAKSNPTSDDYKNRRIAYQLLRKINKSK